MENLRHRTGVGLVSNKKDYLKWTSKKVFKNDLVASCKSKVTLKLNKSGYIRKRILDLSTVLMYKFYYNYIKKYDNKSRLLFTDTYSLMYEIKLENVYEDFSKGKKMFYFSNYSAKSNF